VVLTRLGLSTNELYRYISGTNAPDYFNPDIITIAINEANLSLTRSTQGIIINSTALPTGRVGVADASLVGGIFGDTYETRLRAEPGKLYEVRFRLRQDGASNTSPFIRFNARTIGFGYNATLELLGGRGLASADGRQFLSQVLPGTGNQVPGTTAEGTTYRLLFHSPLAADLRAHVIGTLDQKFPTLMAQPGPGFNAPSLRDINFGFTVVDSLSLISADNTDAAEVANNLTLNQIEVRTHPFSAD
jgi:hypothetical protein